MEAVASHMFEGGQEVGQLGKVDGQAEEHQSNVETDYVHKLYGRHVQLLLPDLPHHQAEEVYLRDAQWVLELLELLDYMESARKSA